MRPGVLFLPFSPSLSCSRKIRDRAENSSARFEFREIKIRERIVFPPGNRSYCRIAAFFRLKKRIVPRVNEKMQMDEQLERSRCNRFNAITFGEIALGCGGLSDFPRPICDFS